MSTSSLNSRIHEGSYAHRKQLPLAFRVFARVLCLSLGGGCKSWQARAKARKQFIICLAGSVDVELDDGLSKRTVRLDQPSMGLYVPQMIWTTQGNFTSDCVYLVLASGSYDGRDYVRNYEDFATCGRAERLTNAHDRSLAAEPNLEVRSLWLRYRLRFSVGVFRVSWSECVRRAGTGLGRTGFWANGARSL